MDTPVRIASIIILIVVIAGAIVSNLDILVENIGQLALITVLFCLLSLSVGFFVPRLFRVERRQAIASSFEIGIHNATLTIVIAQTVLGSMELSLPAAVYGVLMFFVALAFGFGLRAAYRRADAAADAVAADAAADAAAGPPSSLTGRTVESPGQSA